VCGLSVGKLVYGSLLLLHGSSWSMAPTTSAADLGRSFKSKECLLRLSACPADSDSCSIAAIGCRSGPRTTATLLSILSGFPLRHRATIANVSNPVLLCSGPGMQRWARDGQAPQLLVRWKARSAHAVKRKETKTCMAIPTGEQLRLAG
jgi:hypothetical protein